MKCACLSQGHSKEWIEGALWEHRQLLVPGCPTQSTEAACDRVYPGKPDIDLAALRRRRSPCRPPGRAATAGPWWAAAPRWRRTTSG